jgi:hypothetical protein
MFALNILDVSNSGIGGSISFLQMQIGHVRLAVVSVDWLRGHGIDWDICSIRELYHLIACKYGKHCTKQLPTGDKLCIHCGEVVYSEVDEILKKAAIIRSKTI